MSFYSKNPPGDMRLTLSCLWTFDDTNERNRSQWALLATTCRRTNFVMITLRCENLTKAESEKNHKRVKRYSSKNISLGTIRKAAFEHIYSCGVYSFGLSLILILTCTWWHALELSFWIPVVIATRRFLVFLVILVVFLLVFF